MIKARIFIIFQDLPQGPHIKHFAIDSSKSLTIQFVCYLRSSRGRVQSSLKDLP